VATSALATNCGHQRYCSPKLNTGTVSFFAVAERMEFALRIAIVAPTLVLSACATTSQQASSGLDHRLDALVGEPVEVAVARLGEPIAYAQMGSEKVFGWGESFARTEFTNAAPSWVDAAAAQGGVFPAPRRTVPDSCVIRMIVGADGLIRAWDHQGNARGCRAFADRLS
jgi:hypothetical protein